MSEKIEVEVTQDCVDALVIKELIQMRDCLMERDDIDAFDTVIKFYEGAV